MGEAVPLVRTPATPRREPTADRGSTDAVAGMRDDRIDDQRPQRLGEVVAIAIAAHLVTCETFSTEGGERSEFENQVENRGSTNRGSEEVG